jgi:hypothetical protein
MSLPKIESPDKLLGAALAKYIAATGISDLNAGSNILSFFEANAYMSYRAIASLLKALSDGSLDRAEGDVLKKIAFEEKVPLKESKPATGKVNISDSSFTKVSTKVYSGSKAPNIGSNFIYVSDASLFPGSGSIYIGRGTANIEGPLTYSSIVPVGSYYQINLTSSTVKFHNTNETVILAQGGNRSINASTLVKAPGSGGSADTTFVLNDNVILLDGEDLFEGAKVTAQDIGKIGNIPRLAIKEFAIDPFTGASVTNPSAFIDGKDTETDEELRTRIKSYRLSRGLGSAVSIKNAIQGATASDEEASVLSSEVMTDSYGFRVIVDDGSGYERKTKGIGLEPIVDSAIGGEYTFQLSLGGKQTSVTKAYLESGASGPFILSGGEKLAILVGEELSEHTFSSSDFLSPGAANGYEVVASLNGNSTLKFLAATSNNGTKITLSAKAETNEYIEIGEISGGIDANEYLSFPINRVETLRLYKNGLPLSKNGKEAFIYSANQAVWSPSLIEGDTLILKADNTSFVTYTFTNADFLNEGSYASLSSSNSLQSWVNVINNKVIGVTASVQGQQLKLISNLGLSSRAALEIDPSSTMVAKGIFSSTLGLSSTGKEKDYSFSRGTGQIILNTPLLTGESLSAGYLNTEARLVSQDISGSTVVLASEALLWFIFDDPEASVVPTNLNSGSLISVSKLGNNTIRYSSSTPGSFSSVEVGDYFIAWFPGLSSSNRLEGRIKAFTSTSVDLHLTASEYSSAIVESSITYTRGLQILRTNKVPQRLKVAAGTYNINSLATLLQASLVEAHVYVEEDQRLVIASTNAQENLGYILLAAQNDGALAMNFTEGDSDLSRISHIASVVNNNALGSLPSFAHIEFNSESSANPSDSYLSSVSSYSNIASLNGDDPNSIMGFLHPYLDKDSQPAEETLAQIKTLSNFTVLFNQNELLKRIRVLDRAFLAEPLNFGASDQAVVVVDNDLINNTFQVPFYRRIATNTTNANNASSFNAYDIDNSPTAPLISGFGSSFSFNNYKVLMRAKKVLNPSGDDNALLFRSVSWGRSGEKIKVGYFYPALANSLLSHSLTLGKEADLKLYLSSGASIITSIDGTTQWDITITPNTPIAGVDQVTYSWNSVGTAPGLTSLVGGEYINIPSSSLFNSANTGIFRISTEAGFLPTASSFTVQRPTGVAVIESNVVTSVTSNLSFYASNPPTANDIASYISTNLSSWITVENITDGTSPGTGFIEKSSYEDSNFVTENYYLQDGENWIETSNISGSPQFAFKRPLSMYTDNGWLFNNNEELRLVPTTYQQVSSFINTLAVTGLSTMANIDTINEGKNLQLASKTLGSGGAIQVIGGTASILPIDIVGSASIIDNDATKINISSSQGSSIQAGSWIKLEASNLQHKNVGFSSFTKAAIYGAYSSSSISTIEVLNKTLDQRYFGHPRLQPKVTNSGWKVEKQGSLVCYSWNGVGSNPILSRSALFNDAAPSYLSIVKVPNTSFLDLFINSGEAVFRELQIGDLFTLANRSDLENEGTFRVVGVSPEGKTLRVLNPNGKTGLVKGTITILDNAQLTGTSFVIGVTTISQGVEWAIGSNADDTAANIATAISGILGYSASSLSNVVTFYTEASLTNIPFIFNNNSMAGAAINSNYLLGEMVNTGDFSAAIDVKEGDNVSIGNQFNILNRGYFRIIRTFNNSFYIENPQAVEEEITVSLTSVNFGGGASSTYSIDQTSTHSKLSWLGTSTEAYLNNANPGDLLTLTGSLYNDGTYNIIGSQEKLQEITDILCVAASDIVTGRYFLISSPTVDYYFWYNVNGGGGDPLLVGKTGMVIALTGSETSSQVASLTAAAFTSSGAFSPSTTNNSIRVTAVAYGSVLNTVGSNIGGSFNISVYRNGTYSYLLFSAPKTLSETGLAQASLSISTPQMIFWDYEATVYGDKLALAGSLLGSANDGKYLVSKVKSPYQVEVSAALDSQDYTVLGSSYPNLYIEENKAYSGYKKVSINLPESYNPSLRHLVLDTQAQVEKINQDYLVSGKVLGKMEFSNKVFVGLDSYRYDTGMLGEVNRIIYGDPRDAITYAGVGAAGVEILIDPPNIKRLILGIDVRVNTGIPFVIISEQVRSSVSSFIDSSPLGKSISISSIVSIVDSIPGVKAVAISSPQYDSTHDLITLAPYEKARIIDAAQSISISQIGG